MAKRKPVAKSARMRGYINNLKGAIVRDTTGSVIELDLTVAKEILAYMQEYLAEVYLSEQTPS